MKERYRPYSNNGHLLSGKIFCAKCGATYKFKKYGDKHYWTCRTHDKKSELCENGRIAENNIYAAFIRLYNKLMYNYNGAILKKKTAKGKRWYNNKKGEKHMENTLPGAVSLSIDANGGNENFYADNGVYYVINNNSGEDSTEVKTESLSLTAAALPTGLVKAKTCEETDETTYNNWYKMPYNPDTSVKTTTTTTTTKS